MTYLPVNSMEENTESKLVSFKVFLEESDRIRFKIACAEERTTMSQKSKELILGWITNRINSQNKESTP